MVIQGGSKPSPNTPNPVIKNNHTSGQVAAPKTSKNLIKAPAPKAPPPKQYSSNLLTQGASKQIRSWRI